MFKRFKNIFRKNSNNKPNANVNSRGSNVNPEEYNNNDASLTPLQEASTDENNQIENYKILQVEIKGYNPKDIFSEEAKVSVYLNDFSNPLVCGVSDFVNVIATLEEELRSINNDSASREIDNNAQLLKQFSKVLKDEAEKDESEVDIIKLLRKKSFQMQGEFYVPWEQILEVSQYKENYQQGLKSLEWKESFVSLVESNGSSKPWGIDYDSEQDKNTLKQQRSLTF